MTDHQHLEELIAANALGGLDAVDARELERARAEHGPGCAECRRLEAEYADIAGALAFATDPVPLRPGSEDTLVELAAGSRAPRSGVEPMQPAAVPNRRWPVAAAAAVVLFVGGIWVGRAMSNDHAPISPGARVVAFSGDAPGSLSVAYRPGAPGIYLVGTDLPVPPAGHVYEVWMIRGSTPVPGPCVRPSPDGSVVAFSDAELATTDSMAVTVEPSSCSVVPTTTPVFTATLRT
jgi:anti-sigma-K factor RskA